MVKLHDEIVVLNDCLRDKKREGEEREKQLQVDIESKELECHRKCEEKDVYIQEATAVAEELRKKLEVCVREREKLEVEMKKCEDSVTRRDVLLNRAKERVKTLLKEKQELKQQVSIMKKNCEEEIQAMNQRVLDNEEAHKVEVKVLQDDIDKLSRQAALGKQNPTILPLSDLVFMFVSVESCCIGSREVSSLVIDVKASLVGVM